jgi:hypothetical protein
MKNSPVNNSSSMFVGVFLFLCAAVPYLSLSEPAGTDPFAVGALPLQFPIVGAAGGQHTLFLCVYFRTAYLFLPHQFQRIVSYKKYKIVL